MTQKSQDLEKKVQIDGACPTCGNQHIHNDNCSRAEKLLPKYEFVEGEGHTQVGWTK